jgi:hypothetical protein
MYRRKMGEAHFGAKQISHNLRAMKEPAKDGWSLIKRS